MGVAVNNSNMYRAYGILAIIGALLFFIFYDALEELVRLWSVREEYGHGFLIPVISCFLIWLKKDRLAQIPIKGSWVGVALLIVGLILGILGNLSTIYVVVQYAFIIAVVGVVLAIYGYRITKELWAPLLFLAFMIPLPNVLYQGLSAELQLISSELGVFVIRLFGISVYLEGNVIDLGVYQLQVVEACSGLNYLFPLMTLAFITAYFFKAPLWQRATIFISSMPITVLMNSFRIGVIGVLVDKWGIEQAEGFLHSFEGWIIFMACMLILFGEMWLFNKFSYEKKSLSDVFGIELPEKAPNNGGVKYRDIPKSLVLSVLIALVAAALLSDLIETREEIIPERMSFNNFPFVIEDWQGTEDKIEKKYLDILKLDDYIMADYRNSNGETVNFYSAYYQSQRGGASAHSPRSCIPGGGWQIKEFETKKLDNVIFTGNPLLVNRLLIKKGDSGQLVYYWFQQRGRIITNEYLVKFYLFWDALTKNRTDGSLVRLTTSISPGEDLEKADARLVSFLKDVNAVIADYIPQ